MKRKLYTLTPQELEQNIDNSNVVALLQHINTNKPCNTLLESYQVALQLIQLLEAEIDIPLVTYVM